MIGAIGIVGRTLVQGHQDVHAERELDLNRLFRRQDVAGAVQVGLEGDAFLADATQLGQAQDLEAAAVGQDRPIPPHESVQAAERLDGLVAGAEVEVVGVAEEDLARIRVEVPRVQRLHGRLGPHGHEYGCLHGAVDRLGCVRGAGRGRIGAEERKAHGVPLFDRPRRGQQISMASP